jgi:VIT1/CCC1 family predicted Fe2+/Mn2+ transporter
MTGNGYQDLSNEEVKKNLFYPGKGKRLLDPVERVSEILFGLIMALTFTCSISIANPGKTEIRELLFAAIGCNTAWGLVDAIMYIISLLVEKSRSLAIIKIIRDDFQQDKVKKYISETMHPVVASVIGKAELEQIRTNLLRLPESSLKVHLKAGDFKRALSIFLIIFISTFPVVIPFFLFSDVSMALRISNLVAVVMMFFSGWLLAGYANFNKWLLSIAMTVLGIFLVALTVALGG